MYVYCKSTYLTCFYTGYPLGLYISTYLFYTGNHEYRWNISTYLSYTGYPEYLRKLGLYISTYLKYTGYPEYLRKLGLYIYPPTSNILDTMSILWLYPSTSNILDNLSIKEIRIIYIHLPQIYWIPWVP